MKGIVLAGGFGTRLGVLTQITNKHLLPIYDKPLIYYSLSTLMLANVRDILIITSPNQAETFQKLLGNGENYGVNLSYEIQTTPAGIAQGLIIGKDFIRNEKMALILGDNLFHGAGLGRRLETFNSVSGAQIFGYLVNDPSSYGVATLNNNGDLISLEEKPAHSKSKIAIPGLYFFDESASDRCISLKPSERGEFEIIDLLKSYLAEDKLHLELLPRGTAWFDAGTFADIYDAGTYVKLIQERTGERVGDPIEIAKLRNWLP